MAQNYVFGPVPSRRLGRSLGVNNIPAKYCTYSCIYCQLGRTTNLEFERREFYNVDEVVREVVEHVKKVKEKNIDYITIVPDGEPTLDINLGSLIKKIKKNVNVKLAVLTNSSLTFREDVRSDLSFADLVSVKIDAVSEEIFRKVNRPYKKLNINEILDGIRKFSKSYKGKLISETMLIEEINDNINEIKKIANYIKDLNLNKAYIAMPTRPPAESWVKGASEEKLVKAYNIFLELVGEDKVELLTGYEKEEFITTGDVENDILSITSVHPMRIDYASKLIEKAGSNPNNLISKMISEGKVLKINYKGYDFIIRRIKSREKV